MKDDRIPKSEQLRPTGSVRIAIAVDGKLLHEVHYSEYRPTQSEKQDAARSGKSIVRALEQVPGEAARAGSRGAHTYAKGSDQYPE